MRIIKLALVSFVVLFFIATLISLLLPSSVIISRAIDINSTKDSLFSVLNNPERWKYWVYNRDSLPVSFSNNSKKTFILGTTKAWIVSTDSNQIRSDWQVGKGPILPAEFNFIVQPGSDYLTLQWKFVQQVKWYPWEKFASIVSDKILGQFMEKSLDNLKQYVEQKDIEQIKQ